MVPMPGLRRLRLVWLLTWAAAQRHFSVLADFSFLAWPRDPEGDSTHMRLEGGARIDYYSTEFVEYCTETALPLENPQGLEQRFQHVEPRNDPYYDELPLITYLDDGQLDNPFAGNVSQGLYTETKSTKQFIPDGDLLPLPHNRSQLCHYALRMTPPEPNLNTAAWYRFKQLVAYGFETEFNFRVLHRSEECLRAGEVSVWCQRAGGDGFAFVIQNFGARPVGTELGGMGYRIRSALAIEFDTHRSIENGEITGNHIAIMAPQSVSEPNTANHDFAEIAYTDDIPPLQEGTHTVRIRYSVRDLTWDSLGSKFESDIGGERLRDYAAARPGLLTVELDGRRVLAVMIDLVNIAQVDGMHKYQANPPVQPDPAAYDEPGATPGRAWVGFTSSTSYSQWQSVDILSWSFTEYARCPLGHSDDMYCRVNQGTVDRDYCLQNGSQLCSMVVQNAARQPLHFSAKYNWDTALESTPCSDGNLDWDALHPYFLGCSRRLHFLHDMLEIHISTVDGVRSKIVNEPHILQKYPSPFKRESLFRWCITEHSVDPTRLHFAQCNCEFCIRVLDIQASYSVFYQDRCAHRYGLECKCFEVSNMQADQSQWTVLEPMKHMRIHTCRGCSYTSQCTAMLTVALCEEAYQTYTLGRPLAPTRTEYGFQDLYLDNQRVVDGELRGDACNCDPPFQAYLGPEGRRGGCGTTGLIRSAAFEELEYCYAFCRNTANCNYFTYYEHNEACLLYRVCNWERCTTLVCLGNTYQMAPLGRYANVRGEPQDFAIFTRRTLQTTYDDCARCLNLYIEENCLALCGPIVQVNYLHHPAGQNCATCMFAGNRMHELTVTQFTNVKTCVYEATRMGEDPWEFCNQTVLASTSPPIGTRDLFNGVSTHFLSECPGKPFAEHGAVCVPNVLAREDFEMQVLSRMAAINNTVWGPELECLDAVCNLVARSSCYIRNLYWPLGTEGYTPSFNDTVLTVPLRSVNGAYIDNVTAALELNKTQETYAYSDPIPFPLINWTLDFWTEIDESERIENLALNVSVDASSAWSEEYIPSHATDGDLETYWSSQLGEVLNPFHEATWTVDLGRTEWVGEVHIYWKDAAEDFIVQTSTDKETWLTLFDVRGNTADENYLAQFFFGRYVRIVMSRTRSYRGFFQGEERAVYAIREVEILSDDNVARNKETEAHELFYRPSHLTADGDRETYWSTPPGVGTGYIMVDFGAVLQEVTVVQLIWRLLPTFYTVMWGERPCAEQDPPNLLQMFAGGQVDAIQLIEGTWSGRCLLVRIDDGSSLYGESIIQLADVEAYQVGGNAVPSATVISTIPAVEDGGHLSDVAFGFDDDPLTSWIVNPVFGASAELVLDMQAVVQVITVEVTWVEGLGATRFSVSMGLDATDALGAATIAWEVVDDVTRFFDTTRIFVAFRPARYVKLSVTQIPASNVGNRLGLQDIKVMEAGTNMGAEPGVTTLASDFWSSCDSYAESTTSTSTSTSSTTTSTSTSTVTSTVSSVSTATSTTASSSSSSTSTARSTLYSTTSTSSSTTVSSSTMSTTSTVTTEATATSTTSTSQSSVSSSTSTTVSTSSTSSSTSTSTSTSSSLTSTSSSTSTTESKSSTTTSTSTSSSTSSNPTTFTSTSSSTSTTQVGAATGATTTTITTQDPFECFGSTRGTYPLHSPLRAVDLDEDTWWGANLGLSQTEEIAWEIQFDSLIEMDVAVIRWKFPPVSCTLWCSLGDTLALVGDLRDNSAYLTPILFTGTRECSALKIIFGEPVESFASEGVIGMREVELYNFQVNYALGRPVTTGGGGNPARAVDASEITTWRSETGEPMNFTVDMEEMRTAWGIRLLYLSNTIPALFSILISDDGVNYTEIGRYTDNEEVVIMHVYSFSARYVRVWLMQPSDRGAGIFGFRTVQVLGSENLGPRGTAVAPLTWDHGGSQAVDGDNSTFWVAEPFVAFAKLRIDMNLRYFVAGGIEISWKYPAEDFAIWLSNDTVTWVMHVQETGNLLDFTRFGDPFEAQFVEVRMDRPSALNGDGAYAIYQVDILFDMNLAHHKTITATETISADTFGPVKAKDDISATVWMPVQEVESSTIVFDLAQERRILSGFSIHWRYPPKAFRLERLLDGVWTVTHSWAASGTASAVDLDQYVDTGFGASKIAIIVEQKNTVNEGPIVALREILLFEPISGSAGNIAAGKRVEASHDEITGNPSSAITDGNRRGTYWYPAEGVSQAWFIVHLAEDNEVPVVIGRVSIWWHILLFPRDFHIRLWKNGNLGWETVADVVDNTELFHDVYVLRDIRQIEVVITRADGDIGVMQLEAYEASPFKPPTADPVALPFTSPANFMIDFDTGTYWMGPAWTDMIIIDLDIYHIYDVFDIELLWGFLAQNFELRTSTDQSDWVVRRMNSRGTQQQMSLAEVGAPFLMRYLRIQLTRSFQDEENQFGTALRDIRLLKFRNLVRGRPAESSNIWDYASQHITDGDSSTVWRSHFGQTSADLVLDLGSIRNVAGMGIYYEHPPMTTEIQHSVDGVNYITSQIIESTEDTILVPYSADTAHFQARYLRLLLSNPRDAILHPDLPDDTQAQRPILSVYEITAFEHTGGGGVLGLESLDGEFHSTVAFGILQPGEWAISSEGDAFTQELMGGYFPQDIGSPTHIVVTFQQQRSEDEARPFTELTLFRNGVQYGDPYRVQARSDRLTLANQIRLVVGVRSSAFLEEDPEISPGGTHSDTHSPFFSGKVYNITVIRNTLSAEEVRGLYFNHLGGQELGCHCFDACPAGKNKFFPNVSVPCSGQGACLRGPSGVPFAPGVCRCLPGYSGDACEDHCSVLSVYGCCEVDDDCPWGVYCNTTTKACSE